MLGTILRYFPTWSETFVYRELAALRQQGMPLTVLAVSQPRLGLEPDASVLGGPLTRLPRFPLYLPVLLGAFRQLYQSPAACAKALRWGLQHLRLKDCVKGLWMADHFQRTGVRLMHIHFAGEGAELAELIRRAARIDYGVVLHARDLFVPRPSVPDLLQGARYLLCISHFNLRFLAEHHGKDIAAKARVLHLGVPIDAFAPVRRPPHNFHILTISRLVEKKGLPILIDAVHRLRARGIETTLTIVGEGKLRKTLEARIQALKLLDVVRLAGARTQEEIEALFQRGVSVSVMPCVVAADGDQDGIPVSLMEAMARAIPVVSTTVSGIPELIRAGEDGLLVAPGDVDGLVDALQQLHDNPALADCLAFSGQDRVREHFNAQKQGLALSRLLESWLENASTPSHTAL